MEFRGNDSTTAGSPNRDPFIPGDEGETKHAPTETKPMEMHSEGNSSIHADVDTNAASNDEPRQGAFCETRGGDMDEGADAGVDADASTVLSSSSSSYSSSSSTSSSDHEASPTLMERQARNIARNERFLGSLREKYRDKIAPFVAAKGPFGRKRTRGAGKGGETNHTDEAESDPSRDTGMVMGGTHRLFRSSFGDDLVEAVAATADSTNRPSSVSPASYGCGIRMLHRKYPHRESQIRSLSAILSSTISLTATIGRRLVETRRKTIAADAGASSDNKRLPSSSSSSINSNTTTTYVPAPIFCIGPSGTGKTSVVCDVVEWLARTGSPAPSSSSPSLCSRAEVRVQPAYVDCSIVEPSTIDRLVYTIYQQLRPVGNGTGSERTSGHGNHTSAKRRKRTKGARRGDSNSNNAPRTPSLLGDTANSTGVDSSKPNSETKDESTTTEIDSIRDNASAKTIPNENEVLAETVGGVETQPRVLPSRRAKKAAIHKTLANNATTYDAFRKTKQRQLRKNRPGEDDADDDVDENAVETMHSAMLSLGRSLQAHYGPYCDESGNLLNADRSFAREVQHSGILVLDRAEELLSLSAAGKKGTLTETGGVGQSNALSELLLLPKIMKLNVTIVVITKYAILDSTRLNHASALSKGLSNLSNGVHPVVVQFPAYKGNQEFREVLSTEENRRLVMGDSLTPSSGSPSAMAMRPSLKENLIRSFWNTVIQFVLDSTRDVRDFRRIGRALWPVFVGPLSSPSALRSALKGVAETLGIPALSKRVLRDPKSYASIEEELVRTLGRRFYKRVAALSSGDENLTLLALDENGIVDPETTTAMPSNRQAPLQQQNMPYLRSCLLLAAFVCQHNKADQDRKIFSVHGNGRRSKSRAKQDIYGGNDEDLAFGSTSVNSSTTVRTLHQVEQLRSLRLRSIPLERVFSVFVTLVRLNPHTASVADCADDETALETIMDDLGSSRLYRDLSHLMESGHLHSAKGDHQILCSLAKEEALEIAARTGIPLQRYLI